MEKLSRQPYLQSYGRAAAVYDALASVLVRRTPTDRRHVVVLFTEGVDDASVVRPRELYAVADIADAVLYTLRRPTANEHWVAAGVPRRDSYARSLWPPDPSVVEEAARRTGGRVIPALGGSIGEQLAAILEGFRQSYVLTYEPEGVGRSGWHTLEVRLRTGGRYQVTARRGYFASGR
jgi:VWFA-related protein